MEPFQIRIFFRIGTGQAGGRHTQQIRAVLAGSILLCPGRDPLFVFIQYRFTGIRIHFIARRQSHRACRHTTPRGVDKVFIGDHAVAAVHTETIRNSSTGIIILYIAVFRHFLIEIAGQIFHNDLVITRIRRTTLSIFGRIGVLIDDHRTCAVFRMRRIRLERHIIRRSTESHTKLIISFAAGDRAGRILWIRIFISDHVIRNEHDLIERLRIVRVHVIHGRIDISLVIVLIPPVRGTADCNSDHIRTAYGQIGLCLRTVGHLINTLGRTAFQVVIDTVSPGVAVNRGRTGESASMMSIGIQISGVALFGLILNAPQIKTVALDIDAAVAAGLGHTGIDHFFGIDPDRTALQGPLIEIDIHGNGIRLAKGHRRIMVIKNDTRISDFQDTTRVIVKLQVVVECERKTRWRDIDDTIVADNPGIHLRVIHLLAVDPFILGGLRGCRRHQAYRKSW